MSQRNPGNDRTMRRATGQETGGYTRKGASRAKPARESAATVHVVEVKGGTKDYKSMTKEERKEQKRKDRAEADRYTGASNIIMEHDPVYKRRRKIWWLLLGLGLASTALAWVFFVVFQGVSGTPGLIALILAYVFIIGGFVWDWLRIRPIRRETDEMVSHFNTKRVQEIIDEDYEERQAKKAAKARRRGRPVPEDAVGPSPSVDSLNPATALRGNKKRGRGKNTVTKL